MFLWTWCCTTLSSIPIILVLLINKNVALIYSVTIFQQQKRILHHKEALKIKCSTIGFLKYLWCLSSFMSRLLPSINYRCIMVSSYQIGLPLNEIQDSYSATSVQEHLMFAASKGPSHQEKKDRKERDLWWPTMHSFMQLPTTLTGFQNRFGLYKMHVPCWDCILEISEPTVLIAQTGSVSCVAHDLIATGC